MVLSDETLISAVISVGSFLATACIFVLKFIRGKIEQENMEKTKLLVEQRAENKELMKYLFDLVGVSAKNQEKISKNLEELNSELKELRYTINKFKGGFK